MWSRGALSIYFEFGCVVCAVVRPALNDFNKTHSKERGFHIIGGLVICLVGLIGTVTILDNTGRYVALCVLLLGSYITAPLTVAWLSGNTPGKHFDWPLQFHNHALGLSTDMGHFYD